jgi:transcriptional regulator with XRE-family HTH domain
MLQIRLWRLANRLSQVQAARLLGMSHLTYGYLESGRLQPTARDRQRLKLHFGESAKTLFDRVRPDAEIAAP